MITLQFCAFDSPAGRFIRWFSHGRVGHVDVVMDDGRLLGAQARDGLGGKPAGVQIRPANYGAMIEVVRVTLPATPPQELVFRAFLANQIDRPYDYRGIFAFLFERDWRDPKAWFCSELVAAALEAAGIFAHPLAAPANKITPADLLLLCSEKAPVIAMEGAACPT